MVSEKMYSVTEATKRLNSKGLKVSSRTVQRYCERGVIQATKGPFYNSHYHIAESALVEFEDKYLGK